MVYGWQLKGARGGVTVADAALIVGTIVASIANGWIIVGDMALILRASRRKGPGGSGATAPDTLNAGDVIAPHRSPA